MHKISSVIFDLDGTLIDSQKSILKSIELSLNKVGINSVIPLSENLIGPPLNETLILICGTNDLEIISAVSKNFKEIYDAHGYKESICYPGVEELLDKLIDQGYSISLATNKRKIPTKKILDKFNWESYFSYIYTIDSGPNIYESKTQMLCSMLKETGIQHQQALYVGDRYEDYVAATANKLKCALVNWGYGKFKYPNQLLQVFETTDQLIREIRKF